MKNKVKPLSCILLIITFLFISGRQIFGQEKVNISAGVGFPELLNICIKYQVLDQEKIGLSIGWWPESSAAGRLISLSGDFYYHFAGSSEFSDLRPWYGRIGLNCILEHMDRIISWWNSYLRIGRDFYFDKKFGISIDAGLNYHFNPNTTGNPLLAPAFSLCCFYRF